MPRRSTTSALGSLLFAATAASAFAANSPAVPGGVDPRSVDMAREARRAVAIIEAFYADHHACPQPSDPDELRELQSALGDGFLAERQGEFVTISGISMISGNWRYYASPRYPDRCTLWRKISGDRMVIWRRHRYGAGWNLNPGDGTPERAFKVSP